MGSLREGDCIGGYDYGFHVRHFGQLDAYPRRSPPLTSAPRTRPPPPRPPSALAIDPCPICLLTVIDTVH